MIAALAIVLLSYGISAGFGWPQRVTAAIAAATHEASAGHAAPAAANGEQRESGPAPSVIDTHAPGQPPPWTVAPFVLILAAIALLPLLKWSEHWWDNNLHKLYVSGGLGLVTLAYYLLLSHHSVTGHFPTAYVVPVSSGANWTAVRAVLGSALLSEYVPFIVLLFSLYTVSGGIRIQGDLPAHPLTNMAFMGVGAVLASFIGTTGAAMLLIRPLLETNSERKHVKHTVVFFIFIVCNCGGCLLPLGDPPLFLGYLLGVPFAWTLKLWPQWLLVNGVLLAVYYVWDHFWFYPHETKADIVRDETQVRKLQFMGVGLGSALLAGIVLSVALLDPSKPVPGTHWHPWLYLREAVQLALAGAALVLGSPTVRRANNFNYLAIGEVAVLFLGIFICMQPPLQILHVQGAALGLHAPWHFFWASGSLSSVLDNAPTYVVFFETAKAIGGEPAVAGVRESFLTAVSLGSVFMGAMTYIGNGPNFMVKSIAEKSGVAMPSFFGYVVYSLSFLLPLFLLVTWLFF